jgi:hypothetical protein
MQSDERKLKPILEGNTTQCKHTRFQSQTKTEIFPIALSALAKVRAASRLVRTMAGDSRNLLPLLLGIKPSLQQVSKCESVTRRCIDY